MDSQITPHQLELFRQVAMHRGISAASRHMAYGLGQPAISGQIAALERSVRGKLFERRPFQLTGKGELLYSYVGPFFDGLGPLLDRLRGEPACTVRIAVDDLIAAEFRPAMIAAVAPRFPDTLLEFRTGVPSGLEEWLHEHRVDLVVTAVDRRVRGFESLELGRPGLRLLVPRKARIHSPGYFWRQKSIAEPLIWPLETGVMHRIFTRCMHSMHHDWLARIFVDSAASMTELVAGGHGVGLSLELPSQARDPKVRPLPLAGFDSAVMKVLWRPRAGPWLEPTLAAIRANARRLWPVAPLPTAA